MSGSKPPIAEKKPHEITAHGDTRVDDYYWLREKSDPDVIAYLEAENDYTKSILSHTKTLQEALYKDMVGRIQETDEDVPAPYGEYFYYKRTEEGLQYPIHCRKKGSLESEEEIVLDLNDLSKGHDYSKLGVFKVSPDQRTLAYSLDQDGSENFVLFIKDLISGKLLPEQIQKTKYDGEWANDNLTFFYTTQDAAKRDYRLHRHRLGTHPDEDEILYQEDDELYWVNLKKTRDHKYLILTTASIETSEVYILKADDSEGQFSIIHPRENKLQYRLSHHESSFYILTNDNAKNFKIMTIDVKNPSKDNWRELVSHQQEILIEDIDLFSDHLVIYKRVGGLRAIGIKELASGESHDIEFPEPTYTYKKEENLEFGTKFLRFKYMSMTTPDTIYDYDMIQRTFIFKKQKPVLGGFDSNNYVTKRIFAAAENGIQIPISLVYKKGLAKDGSAPCLLYGYGAYGASLDPTFNSNRLCLLDRGFVFAIAHIRGGQEMGRHWYEDGKYLKKKNTFTDFIACGRHLIDEKFTKRNKLALLGGSAGGLLIGAAITIAPDLCQVAVAEVPFVDVVTTMLDGSIPLTIEEFEEWGNPIDKEYYDYLLSYSPYDHVEGRVFPHLLVTAGLNDPRVQYWEPAKWIAKMRVHKSGDNRLLLKTNMGAGHHGASGRYDYLKEIAFNYAFIIDTLEV